MHSSSVSTERNPEASGHHMSHTPSRKGAHNPLLCLPTTMALGDLWPMDRILGESKLHHTQAQSSLSPRSICHKVYELPWEGRFPALVTPWGGAACLVIIAHEPSIFSSPINPSDFLNYASDQRPHVPGDLKYHPQNAYLLRQETIISELPPPSLARMPFLSPCKSVT